MRGIYEFDFGQGVYVGSTTGASNRKGKHLAEMRAGEHGNENVQAAYDAYGEPAFNILEEVSDRADLLERERHWFAVRVAELGREWVLNIVEPGVPWFKYEALRERSGLAPGTPEWYERTRAATVAANAKTFYFRGPDGEPVEVYNLNAFCRDNRLDYRAMTRVRDGERHTHKGYTRI